MRASILCLSLFALTNAAFAASFTITKPTHIDLNKLDTTEDPRAELKVYPLKIEAVGGVRLTKARVREFSPAMPVVLGESYDLKSTDGKRFRMWVHSVTPQRMWMEIVPLEDEAASGLSSEAVSGIWWQTGFNIDGVQGEAPAKKLELLEGGRYRVNTNVKGKWKSDGETVTLGPPYDFYGAGQLSKDRKELRFRYLRGQALFEVVMRKQPQTSDQMASN